MNNYFSLFTLPQFSDFTLYHMGKPFRCNSTLLRAISDVIANEKTNKFTLPSIKGSLSEVFKFIFSFSKMPDDLKSVSLYIAVVVSLDIKQHRTNFSELFKNRFSNPKDLFDLVDELLLKNVDVKDIAECFRDIDPYFYFFVRDHFYESFFQAKLIFFNQVFSLPVSTRDPHNLFKFVCRLYKMYPKYFNESVTNLAKRYFNGDIFQQILELENYDLKQISDTVRNYISKNPDFISTYSKDLPLSFEYKNIGDELNGVLKYFADPTREKQLVLTTSPRSTIRCSPSHLLIREETKYSINDIFAIDSMVASVTFSFKGYCFKPSAYIMKSVPKASDGLGPTSWKLEGSLNADDKNPKWVLLDEVNNNESLLSDNACAPFLIKDPMQSFTAIRITQVESKENSFTLARFELFGELMKLDCSNV